MVENQDFRTMFINEIHSSRKIQSEELRKWILSTMKEITLLQITAPKNIEKFSKKIEKNDRLYPEDVDYFLKYYDLMQEKVANGIPNQIKRLKEILAYNIGNKEILSRIKEELSNNIQLKNQDFRYFQFCLRELVRHKIFETGIVPQGWLPSDGDAELKQLQDQVAKNRKYAKWGIAAAGDDILKKRKIDL